MKNTALISTLFLCSFILLSCSSTVENAVQTNDTAITVEAVTKDPYADDLPDKDHGGINYNIFAAVEQWVNEYYVESITGDVVDDAVYKRNSTLEERFNIKLNYTVKNGYSAGMSEVSSILVGSVMGGSGDYDLILANSAYIAGRIMENIFINLRTLPYQDFTRPWWIENTNDFLLIDDRLYTAAGKYSLSSVKRSWGIYFSKNLIEAYSLENPYDDVNSGRWTIDRWIEYAKQVSEDLDGNGEKNGADRFGIVGTETEPFFALQIGLGRRITKTGDDGYPYLTGADERVCDIFDKLQSINSDTSLYYGTKTVAPDDEFIHMIAADQALFAPYTLNITSNASMREIEQYGILPLPKYDENQEKYYTQCFVDLCSVLKVTYNDSETVSLILEALNAENMRTVIPQYYEIALTRKFTRDDDSAQMIDIICSGSSLDFGTIFYSQLDLNYVMINTLFTKNSTSFATFWAKRGESLEKKLADIVESLKTFS